MSESNVSGAKVRRRALNNRFFFIEPVPAEDAHETCVQLAKSEFIERVYLVEGPYGYIVKTKSVGERQARTIIERLRTQGMRCKSAETFYEYQRISS